MKTSVIISTYNGAHKILNVLRCLEQQTCPPGEVIVVIDGSTDHTKTVLREHNFSLNGFRVVEQENQGRAGVRNRGAKEATGKLLLFLDDDMRPLPNWIEEHVWFHQKYPGGIVTGGLKEEVKPDSPGIIRYKSYLSDKWTSQLRNHSTGVPLQADQIFVTAANCSVTSRTFFEVGGFDNRLRDAEDYDFAYRAFLKSIPLYFHHPAFAWHDDNITFAKYIQRLRQYAWANTQLTSLKPELYGSRTKYQGVRPQGLKKQIFLLFTHKCWIKLADRESPALRVLPLRLRYLLYDLIITANGTYFPERVRLSPTQNK